MITQLHLRRGLLLASVLLTGALMSGCDQQASDPQVPADRHKSAQSGTHPEDATSTSQHGWPRTLQTVRGPVTLQHAPQRIVSTSVTLTGTLLAIDAPVIGSGATARNSSVADDQGFFTQWGSVAKARQVKPLYVTEPNAEAVAAEAPDLIIVAATGGDSAAKLYEQLAAIAPTLVIDYGDKSWQQLAQQLGEITGHENEASALIARFDERVSALKRTITLPPQPVSALVYYEDGRGVNLWTPESAQGKLLTELGFELAAVPSNVHGGTSMGKRNDIIQLSGENMAAGLAGKTLMLFASDDETVKDVEKNPFLTHLDAVTAGHVYSMGPDTFRLDYYSASNMLNSIERDFSKR